jgi:hypothetical protein
VISHAVWLYFRFPLSLRMVEEMLAARGIIVSHESVRQWALKFGQICSFADCTLPKLAKLHPVDPLGNRDFGMLVISDFATEKPCSVFPLHGIARAPSDLHLTRSRPRWSVALACLPPLAAR